MPDPVTNPAAGAGGNGAAPPAAPGSGVSAPPAPGSVAVPPAAPATVSWETAPEQLRTAYQTTKAEADRLRAENEKWTKVGDYEQVSQLQTTFTQRLSAATVMGAALGYTAEQVRAAMLEDPKGTLAYLQQEHARPEVRTQQDEQKRIKSLVDEQVKPVRDMFDQSMNNAANALFEGERDRLFKADFAKGLPEENRDELFEIFDSRVSSDPQALQDLKFNKQTASLAKHWNDAKNTFLKRHNAWIAHERGTAPTVPGQRPPASKDEPKTSFGMTAKELFSRL